MAEKITLPHARGQRENKTETRAHKSLDHRKTFLLRSLHQEKALRNEYQAGNESSSTNRSREKVGKKEMKHQGTISAKVKSEKTSAWIKDEPLTETPQRMERGKKN